MGLLSSIGKGIAKTLDVTSAIVTNPITAVTKGVGAALQKYNAATPIQNSIKTVVNLGTVAATVAGAGALASAARAGTLTSTVAGAASKLIPTTTKGKVIAAVATPLVIGAVAQSPLKAADAISNAPSDLANFGSNLAKFAENPSLANAKEIVMENPLLSAAVGGAAGVVLAKTATSVANIVTTERNTAALENMAKGVETPQVITPVGSKQSYTPQGVPVTPPTQTIAATRVNNTKKRKRYSPRKPQSINQKVSIVFDDDRVDNKKYLKGRV